MKKALVVIGLLAFAASGVYAQASANHNVTVTVPEISWITVTGDITLTVGIPSGSTSGTATDATTQLKWGTNGSGYRVDMSDVLTAPGATAGQQYDLTVEVSGAVTADVGASPGAPAGVLQVDGGTHTLLTGITRSAGHCNLKYTATATIDDPSGAGEAETHQVTYTITS
jgi:hypothetical protein